MQNLAQRMFVVALEIHKEWGHDSPSAWGCTQRECIENVEAALDIGRGYRRSDGLKGPHCNLKSVYDARK